MTVEEYVNNGLTNEKYVESVKGIGEYIIDNAYEIAGDLNQEREIKISVLFEVGCLPTIEVKKKRLIPKSIY